MRRAGSLLFGRSGANALLLSIALLAPAASGCADDDGERAASAEAEEPAEDEAAPEDRADESEGEGAGADAGGAQPRGQKLKVLIKESRLLGNVPSKEKAPGLHTRLEEDRIAVLLEHLNADCGPVPRFGARLIEGVVEVRMKPAEEDTGCVGPHDVKLRIDRPSEAPERLRVVDPKGEELAAGEVTSG